MANGALFSTTFRHMPELDWGYGYPLAIGLMILSTVLPLLYFRRKGWM